MNKKLVAILIILTIISGLTALIIGLSMTGVNWGMVLTSKPAILIYGIVALVVCVIVYKKITSRWNNG